MRTVKYVIQIRHPRFECWYFMDTRDTKKEAVRLLKIRRDEAICKYRVVKRTVNEEILDL